MNKVVYLLIRSIPYKFNPIKLSNLLHQDSLISKIGGWPGIDVLMAHAGMTLVKD